MNRTYTSTYMLVALTAMAVATASNVNAQEKPKLYSVGPAIEFSGGGTSFGIKGRIGTGESVSVRPIILFGYTPSVSGANFSQAVTNGVNNFSNFATLTTEQKRAQIRLFAIVPLTDQQADDVAKKLSLALAIDPVSQTPEQKFYIDKANSSIQRYDLENFKTLTPAQQQAQVKLFLPNATDAVVVDTASALSAALKTPFNNRTPAELNTISNAQGLLNSANPSGCLSLTPAQQKEQVGIFANNAKPLRDFQILNHSSVLKHQDKTEINVWIWND